MDTEAITQAVRKLEEAMTTLQAGPLGHTLSCLLAARTLLLTKYAPYKIGTRVRLARTPIIDQEHSPGWLGSKHYLKQGARGVVRDADVWADGRLMYSIEFDDCSWIDRDGIVQHRPEGQRYQYCFEVSWLEPGGA